MLSCHIFLVGLQGYIAHAQLFDLQGDDWNVWFQQGSLVVGDWLYLDGGEIWYGSNGDRYWMNQTVSIDLSSSWSTSDVTPTFTPHNTGDEMLSRNPTMWYDPVKKMVNWYGGWPYNDGVYPAVWAFDVNVQGSVTWQNLETAGIGQNSNGSSSFSGFTTSASGLSAASDTTYYNLGGYMNQQTDPSLYGLASTAMTGLVEFNFQNQLWSNQSSAQYEAGGFGMWGNAFYVPIFGEQGVLIFLGGEAPTSQQFVFGSSMAPMNEITIYDIQSGNFYKQAVAGATVPASRLGFCGVGAGAADNSSWEIFIFGGYQGGDLLSIPTNFGSSEWYTLGTVSILSLPSFQWITTNANTTQRSFHTCELIGNRQMLSIGGVLNNNAEATDSWSNGLGILDLTDLSWGTQYNASAAPYLKPAPVVELLDNKSNQYPPSWANPALSSIFEVKSSSATSTPSSTPPASVSHAATPTPQSSNTAAIAGGTVGGISILALVVVGAYLLWKRRRGRIQPTELDSLRMPFQYQPVEMGAMLKDPAEMDGREPLSEMDGQTEAERLNWASMQQRSEQKYRFPATELPAWERTR